jgi:transcriptional regulator with XRE-family HTH domain
VTSADIVRIARRRAGITQQQLADRSGHPRESIARWENGTREPSFATLRGVVAACELDLVVSLTRRDTSHREAIADQLPLAPADRLRRLLPAADSRSVLRALEWLGRARSQSIVIGDVAAALLGSGQRPADIAVEVVAADPVAFEAELLAARWEPRDTEERWAADDRRATWVGRSQATLALATRIPGTDDFADLRRSARELALDDAALAVADPRDLLRIAEASPSEKRRARAPGLRALLAELEETPTA